MVESIHEPLYVFKKWSSAQISALMKNWDLTEDQIYNIKLIWFDEKSIVSDVLWVKSILKLLDNWFSWEIISLDELRNIILENDKDIEKIKKVLKSKIDISSLSLWQKVLVMNILDIG